jgi:transposase
LLAGNYLQADETPIRCLDPDVKGKSRQGYLWAYSRPGGDVLFEWRLSRSREGPEEFLKDFRGKLQTDGYYAYESLAKERGDLILVACWAHTRRGFRNLLLGLFELQQDRGKTQARTFPGWRRKLTDTQKVQLIIRAL